MTFYFQNEPPPGRLPDIGGILELRSKINELEKENTLLRRAISENVPVNFHQKFQIDENSEREIKAHSNEDDFYVVYVRLKECKNFKGEIETKEDEWAYLGMTGHGDYEMHYPELEKIRKPNLKNPQGERFKKEPTRKEIESWDKWPPECMIKEAHIFHIVKTNKIIKDTISTITEKVLK